MSRELIAYLPDFYAGSPQVSALQGALDRQTQALWTAEGGLIDQLDVSKATWGWRQTWKGRMSTAAPASCPS